MGYVRAGVEYAIIGHDSGTTILSLANPSAPVVLQEIPAITRTLWHEVDVYQDFAYVTCEATDGLRIIDLSSLPGQCAYKDTVIAGMTKGHTLMVAGDRLYIFGSNIDHFGATVLSLSDPWRPVRIGADTTDYVHDAYVRHDTCYMANMNQGVMTMVDMTNPAAPVTLGSVTTPSAFTHNTWLNDAGTICFTTDELNGSYVAAYDVTNPSTITEVGRYRSSISNGLAVPHNVKVLNDFLVIAYYNDGVNIVDASRPHNMIEVGYYDTNPASGGGYDGIWGLDCFLPSGTIVACDMSTGVWVLEPTYVRACYLEGQVTDASTGNALPGATIAVLSTPAQDVSDAYGNFATGMPDAGTYTVRYSKYGYHDSLITANFANGVLITHNIALRPRASVQLHVNIIDAYTGLRIPHAQLLCYDPINNVKTSYYANSSGTVSDFSFMENDYELIAAQWAYLTTSISAQVDDSLNYYTIALYRGYYDDFTFNLGWNESSFTYVRGKWVNGEPIGTYLDSIIANPEEDVQTDYSDGCLMTGNGGGGAWDNDMDNGPTLIVSPEMDLSGYTNPLLVFDYWFFTSNGLGMPGQNDGLTIEIDNGSQTGTVWTRNDLQQNWWTTDSVQIASYLPLTSTMRIRISCNDQLQDNIVEAAIDKLYIRDQSFVGSPSATQVAAQLTVYPNPSRGSRSVQYDLGTQRKGVIRLLDLEGRQLYSVPLHQQQGVEKLDVALPAGMYFVVLEANGQRVFTQKMAVE